MTAIELEIISESFEAHEDNPGWCHVVEGGELERRNLPFCGETVRKGCPVPTYFSSEMTPVLCPGCGRAICPECAVIRNDKLRSLRDRNT